MTTNVWPETHTLSVDELPRHDSALYGSPYRYDKTRRTLVEQYEVGSVYVAPRGHIPAFAVGYGWWSIIGRPVIDDATEYVSWRRVA